MATPNLTDERLAWLAVRDELQRRSSRGFGQFLLRLGGAMPGVQGNGMSITSRVSAPTGAREQRNARMVRYGIAVDDLSRRLSPDERTTLREHGTVPDWFLPLVIEYAKTVRW
jgi:hypothetical protein